MASKMSDINGYFKGLALVDVDHTVCRNYSEVVAWKNNNNYVNECQIVCWPKITLGGEKYHMSVQLAGVMNTVDTENYDIPYESPSNKNFNADECINAAGEFGKIEWLVIQIIQTLKICLFWFGVCLIMFATRSF